MKSKRVPSGKKHPLLFYRHTMTRLWRISIMADIVLWATWWFLGPGLSLFMSDFIWYGAVVIFIIAIFARLARNMGYVQAKADHLLLATAFLRLKISYRRIVSARPQEFVQLYSPKRMSWADRRFTEPYFGKTILAVILNGYPLSPVILKLFLSKFFFHPQERAGFILVTPDWMALSTEIDSYKSSWREENAPRQQNLGMRGLYGEDE